MEYKISKKLLEAIIGYKIIKNLDNSYIYYKDNKFINDFFFKCKEWATKQGFCLTSQTYLNKENLEGSCSFGYDVMMCPMYHEISFSEQQAVFDACEYILKLKSNK